MNLFQLAVRNITGSAFRRWMVALCVRLNAAFALGATLILRGADTSLRLAIERMGADIVVVPKGSEARVKSALLMGTTPRVWMPSRPSSTPPPWSTPPVVLFRTCPWLPTTR